MTQGNIEPSTTFSAIHQGLDHPTTISHGEKYCQPIININCNYQLGQKVDGLPQLHMQFLQLRDECQEAH
jgi:hypothetical protein